MTRRDLHTTTTEGAAEHERNHGQHIADPFLVGDPEGTDDVFTVTYDPVEDRRRFYAEQVERERAK